MHVMKEEKIEKEFENTKPLVEWKKEWGGKPPLEFVKFMEILPSEIPQM